MLVTIYLLAFSVLNMENGYHHDYFLNNVRYACYKNKSGSKCILDIILYYTASSQRVITGDH